MEEPSAPANPLAEFGPVGRVLYHAARALAIFGGVMFSALVAMSIVSIVGRKLAARGATRASFSVVETAAFASAKKTSASPITAAR